MCLYVTASTSAWLIGAKRVMLSLVDSESMMAGGANCVSEVRLVVHEYEGSVRALSKLGGRSMTVEISWMRT